MVHYNSWVLEKKIILLYNVYYVKNRWLNMPNKLYRFIRFIGVPIFKLLYRPTIIGSENIPSSNRVVLAGNHTHNFDCALLISSTKRTIHFLAKDELHHSKLGWFFKSMATIPVNRRTKDKEALNSAIDVLNKDFVIGIFPEGTFSKDGNLLPFKFGAVVMAQRTNSAIVPFSITGKYRLFKKGITITFSKPYFIKGDLEKENEILREKVIKLIKDCEK